MKPIAIVLLILAPLFYHPSVFAQPQSASAGDSVPEATRQFIMADITGFPLNHTHSGSWQPYQSIRVGYGRKIVDPVEIRVFADYSWFDFDNSDAWTTYDYSRGKRRDIAVYPAIVLFKFAEIALGANYSAQDEVVHQVGHPGDTNPPQKITIDPAVKKYGVYFHFGVGGTLHIAGPVGISLGALFRTDLPNGINFGCRAGIKYEM